MEILVFGAAIVFVAFAATLVVQGVRFYQRSVPARDYRYLEEALGAQKSENDKLRAALEEIAATRYATGDRATHDQCVAVATKALGLARRG
ncbi:MAG: hypothetical protein AAGC46_12000 [Solirubrobacteraceae bacterium]|nr:hypothetical protein [Patulibacter sp.]